MYTPLGSPQHGLNYITINMAKINWSFMKASNNQHAFEDIQTDTQIQNYTHTVAPDTPYNLAKLELCTIPIQSLALSLSKCTPPTLHLDQY